MGYDLSNIRMKSIQRRMDEIEKAAMVSELGRNELFLECCKRAGILPTRRQANKFYRGIGAAWQQYERILIQSVRDTPGSGASVSPSLGESD